MINDLWAEEITIFRLFLAIKGFIIIHENGFQLDTTWHFGQASAWQKCHAPGMIDSCCRDLDYMTFSAMRRPGRQTVVEDLVE